jgi:hypothetical protein
MSKYWLQATPTIGAVDFEECPDIRHCHCGTCVVCGFPKHRAAHGPFLGKPAGSDPFDHQYVEKK